MHFHFNGRMGVWAPWIVVAPSTRTNLTPAIISVTTNFEKRRNTINAAAKCLGKVTAQNSFDRTTR